MQVQTCSSGGSALRTHGVDDVGELEVLVLHHVVGRDGQQAAVRRNLLEVNSEPPGEAGEVVQRLGGKLCRSEARGVPDEVVVEDELASDRDEHHGGVRLAVHLDERHALRDGLGKRGTL